VEKSIQGVEISIFKKLYLPRPQYGTKGGDHRFCTPDSKSFAPRSCYPKNMSPERISPPDAFRAQILRANQLNSKTFPAAERISTPRVLRVLSGWRGQSAEFLEEIIMTKTILAALLLTGSLMVAACNTVEGAGKDVQSAGQAVEDAAD
jgi:predicted small secreted protein